MKERGNFWLRSLDRYLGIPFLYLLSLFKRHNEKRQNIKSILIIKIGTIGDTLLLMPVLKAIKDRYPEVSITAINSRNNSDILNRYSFIDDLRTFEISRAFKNPLYFFRFMMDINNKRYDVVMDFEPWARISAILTYFVKTGYKVGFITKGEVKHLLFDMAIPHSPACHEIVNYISLVNSIGIPVNNRHIGFPIFPSEGEYVEDLLKKEGFLDNDFILFHPRSAGYKGYLKEWGTKNFINLAKLLIRGGYYIGITGTKDDELVAKEIVSASPENVRSFCGKLTIGQVAYLIRKSRLLVTVNTGIMHLGAALGHPMIVLNGPAGILRWGPIGSSKVCNIESAFPCAPCLDLGFEYKCRDGGCMDAIRVETVAQKVYEFLKDETKKIRLNVLA